jgi:hypothetical protein
VALAVTGKDFRQCGIQPLRMRKAYDFVLPEIPDIENLLAVWT